jgi:hypothetical protein
MTTLTDPWAESIPMPVVVAPDLTRLAAELCFREYADNARAEVLAYARALGSLEGCAYVDPDDRAALDALLEDAWPAVRQTSSAWDESPWKEAHRQPVWTLERSARIEALYEVHGATLDADDDGGDLPLPPPAFDDDEPFVPSEADEAFYAAWSDAQPIALDLEPFQS